MRISNKIIEEVVSEVAGADVVSLVVALKNKKNISEFKLAEDLKREVNEVRNMLYRLYNFNLVSFIRKKDNSKYIIKRNILFILEYKYLYIFFFIN